jgi:hypothetical protein
MRSASCSLDPQHPALRTARCPMRGLVELSLSTVKIIISRRQNKGEHIDRDRGAGARGRRGRGHQPTNLVSRADRCGTRPPSASTRSST